MSWRCLFTLSALLAASLAYAEEPLRKSGFTWTWLPKCVVKYPDDYCAKPLPCAPPVQPRGPNDYCAKPLPCAPPVQPRGPNDYCAKHLPPLRVGTEATTICIHRPKPLVEVLRNPGVNLNRPKP